MSLSYFEHNARRGLRDEVALDTIEPDEDLCPTITVRELVLTDEQIAALRVQFAEGVACP